mgnify:CR=1 FL=1
MTDINPETKTLIEVQIRAPAGLVYMKGTPQFPQCGCWARAIEVLTQIGRPFAFVNILENPEIRSTLPLIANWPTFPQLWVNGELIGGSDIILQMYQSGELKPLIEEHSSDAWLLNILHKYQKKTADDISGLFWWSRLIVWIELFSHITYNDQHNLYVLSIKLRRSWAYG